MTEDRLIRTIRDDKFDLDLSDTSLRIKSRKAVRVILLDENDRIGLIYAKNGNYYKLAGGGMNEGESQEEAVIREVIEETGYKSEILEKIGHTIEYYYTTEKYRDRYDGMVGYSYCWVARIVEFVGINLMEDEVGDGFELVWVDNIDKAIELFQNADFSGTKFTDYDLIEVSEKRDKTLLEYYKTH